MLMDPITFEQIQGDTVIGNKAHPDIRELKPFLPVVKKRINNILSNRSQTQIQTHVCMVFKRFKYQEA